MDDELGTEAHHQIKILIDDFLKEKLKLKLTSNLSEAEITSLFNDWIEQSSKNASNLQPATHILKAIHPEAKGTNLFCPPSLLKRHPLVGTHCLGQNLTPDMIGSAAYFRIYNFLQLENNGQSLLTLMQNKDSSIATALSSDREKANNLINDFITIIKPKSSIPTSHVYAKQIYWLVGDDPVDNNQYCLFSPLYPSSLSYYIYQIIREDLFGEISTKVRQSKKDNEYSDIELHEYPNYKIQKFGGTKPQNISFLNSKRQGENYLLASVPPVWKSTQVKEPRGQRSIFDLFGKLPEVNRIIKKLKHFLESDPPKTFETRNYRDDLLEEIIGELYQYRLQFQELTPGWTSRCELSISEQLWLDPQRCFFDSNFAIQWRQGGWEKEIRHRFSNWMNRMLGDNLPLGDIEQAFWMDTLDDEIWRKELDMELRLLESSEITNA